MKNQTVILILGIFIPSLVALVPGTAVTTAVPAPRERLPSRPPQD